MVITELELKELNWFRSEDLYGTQAKYGGRDYRYKGIPYNPSLWISQDDVITIDKGGMGFCTDCFVGKLITVTPKAELEIIMKQVGII